MANKGRAIVINQLPGGSDHIYRVGGQQVGKIFKTPDEGKLEAGRLNNPMNVLNVEEMGRAVQLCSRWEDEIKARLSQRRPRRTEAVI